MLLLDCQIQGVLQRNLLNGFPVLSTKNWKNKQYGNSTINLQLLSLHYAVLFVDAAPFGVSRGQCELEMSAFKCYAVLWNGSGKQMNSKQIEPSSNETLSKLTNVSNGVLMKLRSRSAKEDAHATKR